jgi:hypothetical protein
MAGAAPSRSCTPAEWTSTREPQAGHVPHQMTLAPFHRLSSVKPHHLARLRAGFDALAVDDRRGRAFLAAFQVAAPPGEDVVEMRPDAGRDPGAEVTVQGAARRGNPAAGAPVSALGPRTLARATGSPSGAGGRPRSPPARGMPSAVVCRVLPGGRCGAISAHSRSVTPLAYALLARK